MEVERLSVFARSSPTLPTCSGSECGMSYSPPSASSGRPGADVVQEHLSDKARRAQGSPTLLRHVETLIQVQLTCGGQCRPIQW